MIVPLIKHQPNTSELAKNRPGFDTIFHNYNFEGNWEGF